MQRSLTKNRAMSNNSSISKMLRCRIVGTRNYSSGLGFHVNIHGCGYHRANSHYGSRLERKVPMTSSRNVTGPNATHGPRYLFAPKHGPE